MRNYEVVFIVQPDLDENALTGVVDRVRGWISDAGGAINRVDMWGKRRMAYSIRKQREGQYVFVQAQIAPGYITELERNMRLTESIMRFLVTAAE